jgi:spore coat polysaccharide biosynthesis protein SpsF (cytidylyltransferase family)
MARVWMDDYIDMFFAKRNEYGMVCGLPVGFSDEIFSDLFKNSAVTQNNFNKNFINKNFTASTRNWRLNIKNKIA